MPSIVKKTATLALLGAAAVGAVTVIARLRHRKDDSAPPPPPTYLPPAGDTSATPVWMPAESPVFSFPLTTPTDADDNGNRTTDDTTAPVDTGEHTAPVDDTATQPHTAADQDPTAVDASAPTRKKTSAKKTATPTDDTPPTKEETA